MLSWHIVSVTEHRLYCYCDDPISHWIILEVLQKVYRSTGVRDKTGLSTCPPTGVVNIGEEYELTI
jgi:hypothetical protein